MTSENSFLLRRNDRIVFLGDSITEQQLYTNYVESYLASRFPELDLTFFNAGWGGDTAPGGAARLARDVLPLRPTVVTICYGMNDGRYTAPTDEIRDTFAQGMRTLVARLRETGCRIVLLTPGIVDEGINPALAQAEYNRAGLRRLADEVTRLAADENLPVCDLHALMTDVDARAKAADATFCMVPDGVHPDPAGHLVMAFGLLQALGVPPRRQEVAVDLSTRKTATSTGLSARHLLRDAHGFGLELQLDRLPFFVEPLARKVLPFLPFQETFNQLTLRVEGLKTSRACLRSPAARGPSIAREELAAGIDLFSQWSLDAVQRAEQVHRYTLEKNQIYYRIWRVLGLNGVNSSFHNARAHAAGVRLGPVLDRSRRVLLVGRAALTCRLRTLATDAPGEPLSDGDFISQWSLRGPFPKPYADDRLGGEAAFSACVPASGGHWLPIDLDLAAPGNNLCAVFGAKTDCFVYAVTRIESPVAQTADLLLGSDDGLAVWLNGEALVNHLELARGLTIDQDRVSVRLRAGANVLLLKISQGMGGWGMCARFTGLQRPVSAQRP
jgi:lysophospholipase L1-like esterase